MRWGRGKGEEGRGKREGGGGGDATLLKPEIVEEIWVFFGSRNVPKIPQ